jgi:hypothetical protein
MLDISSENLVICGEKSKGGPLGFLKKSLGQKHRGKKLGKIFIFRISGGGPSWLCP